MSTHFFLACSLSDNLNPLNTTGLVKLNFIDFNIIDQQEYLELMLHREFPGILNGEPSGKKTRAKNL